MRTSVLGTAVRPLALGWASTSSCCNRMPPGPASVCPQAWMTVAPGSAATMAWAVVAGIGAAPYMQTRRLDRSRVPMEGLRSRKVYIVGTPKNIVMCSRSSVSSTFSGSKAGRMTCVAP